jgi:S-DNA-T family DNA segregation ATPase FtsK/SpoIIIE
MLYAPIGSSKPLRVQGCYITPEEIERVVRFVKSTGEAQYSDEVIRKIEENVQEKERKSGSPSPDGEPEADEGADELLPAAVEVILETGQASVSMLQRRLKLGYSRAARLVDQMEQKGYVGPFEGSKPRQLLITREKWAEIKMGGSAPVSSPDSDDDAPWEEE